MFYAQATTRATRVLYYTCTLECDVRQHIGLLRHFLHKMFVATRQLPGLSTTNKGPAEGYGPVWPGLTTFLYLADSLLKSFRRAWSVCIILRLMEHPVVCSDFSFSIKFPMNSRNISKRDGASAVD